MRNQIEGVEIERETEREREREKKKKEKKLEIHTRKTTETQPKIEILIRRERGTKALNVSRVHGSCFNSRSALGFSASRNLVSIYLSTKPSINLTSNVSSIASTKAIDLSI